jgi:two-component SAPR family response regulator
VSRRLSALCAVGAMVAIVVGVPVLLLALVGNPWPGSSRLEMRDGVAALVGVLAVLAWLVWVRFVFAVAVELRSQLAELRELAAIPPATSVHVSSPPARSGTGLLAQRLVAAALVLLPIGPRVSHARGGDDLATGGRAVAAVVAMSGPAPVAAVAPAAPGPTAPAPAVTVADGDTLFGLARTHLGDSARWREIFELNRDRLQSDGGRLASPSLIRTGWVLTLPNAGSDAPAATAVATPASAAPGPYLAAAQVTVAEGDNLWQLSRQRLSDAGLIPDNAAIADYVHAVVEGNRDVIEDPNLIYVGEQLDFPAVGTPPPAPAEPAAPAVAAAAVTATVPVEATFPPAPPSAAPAPAAPPAPTTSTSTTTTPPPVVSSDPEVTPASHGRPSPIGLGEAALLSGGVLALLASRRRLRLRASRPRARVPEPSPDAVAAERRLRAVDAGERLLRVDIAVRAAAAFLVDGPARIALVCAGTDGVVELELTSPAELPTPWVGGGTRWELPGSTPVELLAEAARTVGAPCVALAQLGVTSDGRELLADLEALGVLAIDAPPHLTDDVVRGLAATLATSIFAEVANLIGTGIDEAAFLDHRHAHTAPSVDGALELAATLVGTTSAAACRQSTFVLRARHTSGEAWEPAVVLVGPSAAHDVVPDVVRTAARRHGGVALVVGAAADDAPWTLRAEDDRWVLDPIGRSIVPVGLTDEDIGELEAVLEAADAPLVEDASENVADARLAPIEVTVLDDSWSLLVRLLGPVDVVDREGRAAVFERSKALELIAWLTMHRERATRVGARTALWELDVRDATFANVVSEARRAMARLVEPPPDSEWLGRTLTEVLPLHAGVVADVDIVRHRLDAARLQPPELAIDTLRPAVALLRDVPFHGTGYLWPDAEGIQSNLVLLATGAATELAGHHLSMGDVDGVFWATDRGLRVLPGHEELIALRMRAHARAGDLSGVRLEWESYERALNADPWGDGEPAPKLVLLRHELLSSGER